MKDNLSIKYGDKKISICNEEEINAEFKQEEIIISKQDDYFLIQSIYDFGCEGICLKCNREDIEKLIKHLENIIR